MIGLLLIALIKELHLQVPDEKNGKIRALGFDHGSLERNTAKQKAKEFAEQAVKQREVDIDREDPEALKRSNGNR
jgi:hypothetical protein